MAEGINIRVCPFCGAPIVPYQERCLACLEYLWELADKQQKESDSP